MLPGPTPDGADTHGGGKRPQVQATLPDDIPSGQLLELVQWGTGSGSFHHNTVPILKTISLALPRGLGPDVLGGADCFEPS